MAVKKKERGKIVVENVNNTNFDIRQVPISEGHGKSKKIISYNFSVFRGKHELKPKNERGGFKNIEEAKKFAISIYSTYNKKTKTFKQ